jgi:hypothetical protein
VGSIRRYPSKSRVSRDVPQFSLSDLLLIGSKTSVCSHIIKILRTRDDIDEVIDHHNTDTKSLSEGDESDNFSPSRPFLKSRADLQGWINTLEHPSQSTDFKMPSIPFEGEKLSQIPSYLDRIPNSDAYCWLVSKIRSRSLLTFALPNTMEEIGSDLLRTLSSRSLPRRMSRRKPLPVAQVRFVIDWELQYFVHQLGISPLAPDLWDRILCLVGTLQEAQALTVAEYIFQTWPTSGGHILVFLLEILETPAGKYCSCMMTHNIMYPYAKICLDEIPGESKTRLEAEITASAIKSVSIIGGSHAISELAEQIAWLAATLRPSRSRREIVRMRPLIYLTALSYPSNDTSKDVPWVTYRIDSGTEHDVTNSDYIDGCCWTQLFARSALVTGYPTLRRLLPRTGLEISLKAMASMVNSTQVVQYENRMIMKGFNALLVATAIHDGVILWHAMMSSNVDERVSYFDPRIDKLNISHGERPTLRVLEGARHIVGWCSQATDFCGQCSSQRDHFWHGEIDNA